MCVNAIVSIIGALCISGKVPFDLAEAESELVAGLTTEVGGATFSFLLLVDYVEFLI